MVFVTAMRGTVRPGKVAAISRDSEDDGEQLIARGR